MIRTALIFFTLFFFSAGYSSPFIETLLDKKPIAVGKLSKETDSLKFYYECHYAKYTFIPEELKIWLSKYQVKKVTLVYTRYRTSETFNQRELNKNRYLQLFSIVKELKNNSSVEWNVIEQTGCHSREEGNSYFHGFILDGTPYPTLESMKKELEFIDDFLFPEKSSGTVIIAGTDTILVAGKEKDTEKKRKCPEYPGGFPAFRSYIERNIKRPNVMNEYLKEGFVTVRSKVMEDGRLSEPHIYESLYTWADQEALRLVVNMPHWTPGTTDNRTDDYNIRIRIHFGRRTTAPEYICMIPEDSDPVLSSVINGFLFQPDKTIPDVFDRNPSWSKMLVVCDVTGSMSKYNAPMFAWIKKKLEEDKEKISRIVFFNDGDMNQKKIIGKTGGIYLTEEKEFARIIDKAKECMMNGSGGDTPENNIEAILEGMKNLDDYNEIIMIADNLATPRDLELISSIKKPVRVIICGRNSGVNIAYLNLARSTGGSVHTAAKDYDLSEYKERESFHIEGFDYVIRKGKIEFE